ncbi:hypothetical protein GCM10011391_31370 [Pullulanibacillus camelliae]|uniref:Pyridoxamine 5'-phosphate oxidase family protein n=1 Tax=Pullulanibacillus camelliae TaxID=1707096 RepID=A0A8J2YL63_9BACL|nr:pyridoxamine 5'-phosphate oxidase family protein [Pullulanibacillus camelliae]GGE50364.1 hypothetical protein GCM10011391_31370 [Pullulanibacillus camelliae]
MAKLPRELYGLFNGQDLHSKQHEAMMLLSVSKAGYPHTAMVSVGEVVAISDDTLRLALWPNSLTTGNITRTGKAMLVVFYNGKACYLTLDLQPLPELTDPKYPLKRFIAHLTELRVDTAKYADITSGVQIQLKNSEEVLIRWQETLEELLK